MSDKVKEKTFYRSTIKDWPEDERPREKLLKFGPSQLSDAELLAILLRTGSGESTAVDLARNLMSQENNLKRLSERAVGELKELKGIGDAKALTLISAFELGRRLASGGPEQNEKVVTPWSVAEKYIPMLESLKQEEFRVLHLNSANRIIGEEIVTKGSLNASIVHPREVFKKAITDSAASIIVIHNHPSGNPEPSREDRMVTEKLKNAGEIVGIELIDHIVIAGKQYYSFAENKLL
ncbi:MAG: JAB domain-containing protein [bacterium]|nr:JAB domain-containing protein [bacterium]